LDQHASWIALGGFSFLGCMLEGRVSSGCVSNTSSFVLVLTAIILRYVDVLFEFSVFDHVSSVILTLSTLPPLVPNSSREFRIPPSQQEIQKV
jgi:hypothetical protein